MVAMKNRVTLETLTTSFLTTAIERAIGDNDAMARKEYIDGNKLSMRLSVKQFELLMTLVDYRVKRQTMTQSVLFEGEKVGAWEYMDYANTYTIIFYLFPAFVRTHPIAIGLPVDEMVALNAKRFKGREVSFRECYEDSLVEHRGAIESVNRYAITIRTEYEEAFSSRVTIFHPKFYLTDLAVLRPVITHTTEV